MTDVVSSVENSGISKPPRTLSKESASLWKEQGKTVSNLCHLSILLLRIMYHSIYLYFVCTTIAFCFFPQKVYAQEDSSVFPKDLQLYPRDVTENEAIVPLRGTVDANVYKRINIEVYRESELWFSVRQEISADQNSYNYDVSIRAELAEYEFYLYGTTHNDEHILLKIAQRVVAGDAFLVHGQSNAVGTGSSDEPNILIDQHPFARTFGSTVRDETVVDYPHWYVARTRLSYSEGVTSVWAGRLCVRIIETQAIPCAVINGAYPGEASYFFLSNVDDRFDLTTVHGRLLWRSMESGLQNKYRAIFWYQGESDGRDSQLYESNLEALFTHWADDFPSLEHHFILQIRYGCGTIDRDNMIFEIQRQQQNRPDTTVIPTNGIEWYDGCHYHAPGYEILGDQLFYPVLEKLYGATQLSNVYAPNILSAKQTDHKHVTLILDMPEGDELIVEEGFHIDFTIVRDDGSIIIPIDGMVSGNILTLTLRRETILFDATVGYVGGNRYIDLGLDSESSPRIMNLNNIHLLNFWDEPIEPFLVPTKINLQSTTMVLSRSSLSINLWASGLLVCLTTSVIICCKAHKTNTTDCL